MKLKIAIIVTIVGGYTLLNAMTFHKLAQEIKLNTELREQLANSRPVTTVPAGHCIDVPNITQNGANNIAGVAGDVTVRARQ
jgi:hypothetical protein